MRTLLSKAEKTTHIGTLLTFKRTVSRGRETDGWNICSLYIDRVKKYSCNGGGYDMKGTCLADFIKENFGDQLKKLTTADCTGLTFYKTINKKYKRYKRFPKDGNISLNGACGMNSIERILNKIGFKLKYIDDDIYILT